MSMMDSKQVESLLLQTAVEESPKTAEGWLNHFNGNISKCAEALGVSNATLRKHRDNNTLGDILIYNGRVYLYKNDVAPIEANLIKSDEWERIDSSKAPLSSNAEGKARSDIKVTRDPNTGRVNYWRRKNV